MDGVFKGMDSLIQCNMTENVCLEESESIKRENVCSLNACANKTYSEETMAIIVSCIFIFIGLLALFSCCVMLSKRNRHTINEVDRAAHLKAKFRKMKKMQSGTGEHRHEWIQLSDAFSIQDDLETALQMPSKAYLQK